MTQIKTFQEISKSDVAIAGGKGASLGEMIQAGIPVPDGFIITTDTYNKPLDEKEIFTAFDKLETQYVAVRSSATAEDSSNTSWAGQLETYLNVTKDNLIESIKKCWASIKTDRALCYAKENNIPKDKQKVAVVVQAMIDSQMAGVIFTANPITSDRQQIILESCFGLGESLVQGLVTPDNFVIDKENFTIINKNIVLNSLTNNQVIELAKLSIKIENHYNYPQDIEWAIDKNNKIFILQSRPITTLKL
jgi:rifampicin phosphotransferase